MEQLEFKIKTKQLAHIFYILGSVNVWKWTDPWLPKMLNLVFQISRSTFSEINRIIKSHFSFSQSTRSKLNITLALLDDRS